jgi:hypothetical protein
MYLGSGAKNFVDTFLKTGIPLAPFPLVEHCLGLTPKDSSMAIKDGYAIMSFDYRIQTSSDNCIFNMDGVGERSTSAK